MTAPLTRNWQLVRHTESALRSGSESLGNVPGLLRQLLSEEAWCEFALPTGESVTYSRFPQFVAAKPPRGLGANMELIDRIAGTDDPDLLRLLKAAKAVQRGRPVQGEKAHESCRITESTATADRLAREAPEQYEAVRSGELSLNAAAVLAGIRPRRISVRLDDPTSIARSLRRHLSPEQVAALITELSG